MRKVEYKNLHAVRSCLHTFANIPNYSQLDHVHTALNETTGEEGPCEGKLIPQANRPRGLLYSQTGLYQLFSYFRSLLRLDCWSGGPTRGYTDPEPAGPAHGAPRAGYPAPGGRGRYRVLL